MKKFVNIWLLRFIQINPSVSLTKTSTCLSLPTSKLYTCIRKSEPTNLIVFYKSLKLNSIITHLPYSGTNQTALCISARPSSATQKATSMPNWCLRHSATRRPWPKAKVSWNHVLGSFYIGDSP